jgi:hypothetical protein
VWAGAVRGAGNPINKTAAEVAGADARRSAAFFIMGNQALTISADSLDAEILGPAGETTEPSYKLGFALFILLNAVLFIRPAEILPSLEGLPIYNVVVIACILASLPVLLRQLSWTHLRANPAIVCVIGLLPAIVLSQLAHGNTWSAREGATDFCKVLLFFLLLSGLVNSSARLGTFLIAVAIFVVAIAAVAELNYHGVIKVSAITTEDRAVGVDGTTGDSITVQQLYGPGIFNDPNDFSLILSAGILILIYLGLNSGSWLVRLSLLATCAVPGYAFALTRSRGGFLALAAGLAVLAVSRFGWKRSIPLGLVALPVMLVLFGGRMTNISLDEDDTAQGRLMLWREGFSAMKTSPVFGIGYGTYADEMGLVAHNSYVHTFTELGLFGGIIFTAAFYVPLSMLRRGPTEVAAQDALGRLRPAIFSVLAGYAIGLCSLSRPYTVSTYLILGLGSAYCNLCAMRRPHDTPILTARYMGKLVAVGVACLLFFNVLVRLL